MSPSRYACLIMAMLLTLSTADASHARKAKNGTHTKGSAFVSKPRVGTSAVKGRDVALAAGPGVAPYSILQGAGCGTIGPVGVGAVASPAIVTPEAPVSEEPHRLPPIPTLLFFTLTLTAAAWGLQDIGKRRRLSIINVGVVVGAVVLALGFTWNLFNQSDEHYSHFSLAEGARGSIAFVKP